MTAHPFTTTRVSSTTNLITCGDCRRSAEVERGETEAAKRRHDCKRDARAAQERMG